MKFFEFFVIGIMTIAIIGAWIGLGILFEKYPWIPVILLVTPVAAFIAWVLYPIVLGVKSPRRL